MGVVFQVMDFVSHYRPEDENEIFEVAMLFPSRFCFSLRPWCLRCFTSCTVLYVQVMNILEDRMTHSNSAVVLAVCKLYLHITLSMPATHQQVCAGLTRPLF